jgi:hypothetical protein
MGAVTLDASGVGEFRAGDSCSLRPTANPGVASCEASYTPGVVGSGTQTITGTYGGDGGRLASYGSTIISVTPLVRIAALKLIVRAGTATITISCRSLARFCDGVASIYMSPHPNQAGGAKPVGHEHFHILSGKTAAVEVRLSERTRMNLGLHHTLPAIVVVTAHDGARASSTTSAGATLVLGERHGSPAQL